MLFQKIINLSIHFIELYSNSTFKLKTVEYGKTTTDTLVIFINTTTNAHVAKNLERLFNNEVLLSKFSPKDAGLIGYAYGRMTMLGKNNNGAISCYNHHI